MIGSIYLFLQQNKTFEKNAFCAGFKDQAADRIRNYYTNGDITNIYPDEIFYSKKKNICVALWSNTKNNPSLNGYSTTKSIFNPITNKDIFSTTLYYFDNTIANEQAAKLNELEQESYDEILAELRD